MVHLDIARLQAAKVAHDPFDYCIVPGFLPAGALGQVVESYPKLQAGSYPLESAMRVSDLLRAAGGLEDAAYVNSAELSRYKVVNGERSSKRLMGSP